MDTNRFIELLTRKKSGNITLPESRELNDYLAENTSAQEWAALMDDVFNVHFNFGNAYDGDALNKAVANINTKIDSGNRHIANRKINGWIRYGAIAASILIAVVLIYHFINTPPTRANANIVATKKGSKTNITLPDGSKVWLNADSKITYGDHFGKDLREVNLTGEAYFDVVKDASHPFVIHTDVLNVKVLGTAFNVRAYPEEKNTETTLLRGSIQVTLNKNQGQVIVLKPQEKLVVQNDYTPETGTHKKAETHVSQLPLIAVSEIKMPVNDSVAIETQWVKNRLAFNDQSLEEVAREISRWFGVEVIVKGEGLKSKHFNGSYKDQNLQQVMESLKLAGGFHYNVTDNTVIITP